MKSVLIALALLSTATPSTAAKIDPIDICDYALDEEKVRADIAARNNVVTDEQARWGYKVYVGRMNTRMRELGLSWNEQDYVRGVCQIYLKGKVSASERILRELDAAPQTQTASR